MIASKILDHGAHASYNMILDHGARASYNISSEQYA